MTETQLGQAIAGLMTLGFVWSYRRKWARVTAAAGAPAAGASAASGGPRPVVDASQCIGCGSCVEACPEQGALALVSGKAMLVNPERCHVHGACVTACPTSSLSLKVGGGLRTMRAPRVTSTYETNVPGVFVAGELGGLGLIKSSINEGHVAADDIVRRLKLEGGAPEGVWDAIVVGAGPAGLSAALTLHSEGVRYLALEQGEVASTIRNYPRRKFLMAEPLAMPLYGRLFIADSTKEALLEVWEKIIAETGVRIRTNTKVEGVARDEETGLLRVRTSGGEERARFVVLAIGKRGTPRRLGVPGEEQGHVAYRLIEAESYEGNALLVVGGGDSALEAALGLAREGRNRVTLVHRGTAFDRARERNQALMAKAESEGRIEVLRKAQVKEIGQKTARVMADGAEREVAAEYVFVFAGGESPEDFLKKTGVEVVEKEVAA